ncbi:hypothetical protein LAV73_09105 [Lysinibacillus xylanilyticus]|uniref:hypothetical protein n=1 Tax=Lysinibacillus xylanilyticus TaxID=582475 RepID=UPI002B24B4FC|nr:hypothetical protein [Lysinibacillus xylanilyticus]MEB2280153.1 hypothetical protein [Lysinibacillus xylanilyticus]
MNSSVYSAINIGLSALLFAITLAYALSPITNIQKEFENSPGTVDTVYSVQTKIPEEVLFSGAEVISSIYKLNLDGITVKVNGTTFKTPKDVKDKLSYISKYANYSQSITYDTKGKVTYISYVTK